MQAYTGTCQPWKTLGDCPHLMWQRLKLYQFKSKGWKVSFEALTIYLWEKVPDTH